MSYYFIITIFSPSRITYGCLGPNIYYSLPQDNLAGAQVQLTTRREPKSSSQLGGRSILSHNLTGAQVYLALPPAHGELRPPLPSSGRNCVAPSSERRTSLTPRHVVVAAKRRARRSPEAGRASSEGIVSIFLFFCFCFIEPPLRCRCQSV